MSAQRQAAAETRQRVVRAEVQRILEDLVGRYFGADGQDELSSMPNIATRRIVQELNPLAAAAEQRFAEVSDDFSNLIIAHVDAAFQFGLEYGRRLGGANLPEWWPQFEALTDTQKAALPELIADAGEVQRRQRAAGSKAKRGRR